jgi:hypothetical protein
MTKKHIILAAGHGGSDPGAVFGMTTEAQLAIEIVEVTATILANNNVPVSIVPHSLALSASIGYVNGRWYGPNSLAVEVHKDSFGDPSVDGVSVWHESGNAVEQRIADVVGPVVASGVGKGYRGTYPDTANRHGRLGWVHLKVDSILIECGFGSSATDASSRAYGSALAAGLLRVLGKTDKREIIKGEDSMYAQEHGHVVQNEKSIQIANPHNSTLNCILRVYDALGDEMEVHTPAITAHKRWGRDLPVGAASLVVRSKTGAPYFTTRVL